MKYKIMLAIMAILCLLVVSGCSKEVEQDILPVDLEEVPVVEDPVALTDEPVINPAEEYCEEQGGEYGYDEEGIYICTFSEHKMNAYPWLIDNMEVKGLVCDTPETVTDPETNIMTESKAMVKCYEVIVLDAWDYYYDNNEQV